MLVRVFINIESCFTYAVGAVLYHAFAVYFRVCLWRSGNPQHGDSKAASSKDQLHARLDPSTGEDRSYWDRRADTSVFYDIVQSIYHWTHSRVDCGNAHFSYHWTYTSGHHCNAKSIYHWVNVHSVHWFPAVCQGTWKTVTIRKVPGTKEPGKGWWVWNSRFCDYMPDLNILMRLVFSDVCLNMSWASWCSNKHHFLAILWNV